jgi:hypothetical protein
MNGMKKGMTLGHFPQWKKYGLRFVLVTGILILAVFRFLYVAAPPFYARRPGLETMSMIQALTTAYATYVTDNGSLPKNVENRRFQMAISGDNAKKEAYMHFNKNQVDAGSELVDAWGTPLRISYLSDAEVSIISAGPDKIFSTADDLTNQ